MSLIVAARPESVVTACTSLLAPGSRRGWGAAAGQLMCPTDATQRLGLALAGSGRLWPGFHCRGVRAPPFGRQATRGVEPRLRPSLPGQRGSRFALQFLYRAESCVLVVATLSCTHALSHAPHLPPRHCCVPWHDPSYSSHLPLLPQLHVPPHL